MATIQAFSPIRPNPLHADQLVFAKPQAESVAGDFPPLKTLLETGARLRPETNEGQLLAYQDIEHALHDLIEQEKLWAEASPGIYIYEVVHNTYRQTGVWALTALEDYTSGRIKIHELTFADSVRRLKNYRENTGLEGSPVLLTYSPDQTINHIISETQTHQPKVTLGNQNGLHKIWKIEDTDLQEQLVNAFARIPTAYLADGHHRLESASKLAMQRQKEGLPVYTGISSLYMAADQLRIEPYDRVVVPEIPLVPAEPFKMLSQNFYIKESTGNQPVLPMELHHMGMYFDGEWFHLLPKHAASGVDAAILQEQILLPVFGIEDPKTDKRLICAGGEKALEEILGIFRVHPTAIAFTLSAMTVEQLIRVAEAGQILPPKSTWIVPKVPYGLLIQRHGK